MTQDNGNAWVAGLLMLTFTTVGFAVHYGSQDGTASAPEISDNTLDAQEFEAPPVPEIENVFTLDIDFEETNGTYIAMSGLPEAGDTEIDTSIEAAAWGDLETLQELYQQYRFDEKTMFDMAAAAAENGQNQILAFLLDQGLNINSPGDAHEYDLLRLAASSNQSDTVNFLIDNGLILIGGYINPEFAFSAALRRGYTETARILYQNWLLLLSPAERQTILDISLANSILVNPMQSTTLLIEYGADSSWGNHRAIEHATVMLPYDDGASLDFLLENGGSQRAANEHFLSQALQNGDFENFLSIINQDEGVLENPVIRESLFFRSINSSKIEFVSHLVGNEENPIDPDTYISGVINAAYANNPEIMRLLLESKSDLSALYPELMNEALFVAIEKIEVNPSIIQMLLDHGSNPHAERAEERHGRIRGTVYEDVAQRHAYWQETDQTAEEFLLLENIITLFNEYQTNEKTSETPHIPPPLSYPAITR